MSDNRDGQRVTFQCPDELLAEIDELADEQGRTRSEVLRDCMRRYRDVNEGDFAAITDTQKNLSVTVDRLIDEVHWLSETIDDIEDAL